MTDTAKTIDALTEYEKRMHAVMDLKEVTDTTGWRRHYDTMMDARKKHEVEILHEDKKRAIVAHQEAIKFINFIFQEVQSPVTRLNEYCASMPLFAAQFHTRAVWNTSIGAVELNKSRG